jgi:dTDP-4-dehydrorhamnose reductase
MRIAITGAAGQLGRALCAALQPVHDIVPLDHAALELSDPTSVSRIANTGADLVIHSAAYTNVDGCARDPVQAYRINGLGTRYVALGCQRIGAALVYISTNEVFGGDATQPYLEYDTTAPVNPYGASKLIGEHAVRECLAAHYIVRVAWLFGGERNFVRTVLRLASERRELTMVADEIGSPTATPDAAAAIAQLIDTGVYGTYHIVNAGHCSRFELARTVLDGAGRHDVVVRPIALADYPRPGRVPRYTPLRNLAAADLGITLRDWRDAVAEAVLALR